MASAEKKGSGRFIVLIVLCVVIMSSFGVYFWGRGLFNGAVPQYFIETFAPQLGNSLIVLTLLWWFGAPAIGKMVAQRKATIERDIDESRSKLEAARKIALRAQENMSSLSDEKKQIAKSYQEATTSECNRIRQEAEESAARIERDARTAFELQSGVARREFEKDIMRQSVERARKDIEKRLAEDESLRDKLIERSIASFDMP